MKWREYHDLAERLDAEMRADPQRMMRRSIWYGVSGYIYVVLISLLFSALLGGVLFAVVHFYMGIREYPGLVALGCFLLVAVIFLCVIGNKAWVRIEQPKGWKLKHEEAPEIFRMIEESRQKLNAPPVHEVLLQDMYNAGMSSVPRFGLFGFSRHYVLLGLPFLMAHRPNELFATIAHEIGHTTGQQSRLHRWLYRLSRSWAQLQNMKTHDTDVSGSIISNMAEKYSTGLWVRSNIIRRHYEFVADRASLDVAGREAAIDSLYRVEFYGEAMSRWFFRSIWRQSVTEDLPPMGIWEKLQLALAEPLPPEKHKLVSRVLANRRTLNNEDHPCLRERLAALDGPAPEDIPPCEPIAPEESSLMLLTEACRAKYIDLFANTWRASVIANWRQAHANAKDENKFLAEIEGKPTLSEKESLRLMHVRTNRAESAEESERLLRAFLVKNHGNAEASFRLGELLLNEDRLEDALPFLDAGIAGCSDRANDGLRQLRDYYERYGMADERERTERRLEDLGKKWEKANYENSTVFIDDKFAPHDLDGDFVEKFTAIIKNHDPVMRAWLVRKIVKQFADMKSYVLMIETNFKKFDTSGEEKDRQIAHSIAGCTTMPLLVVHAKHTFDTPRKNIESVPGSLIFDRTTA